MRSEAELKALVAAKTPQAPVFAMPGKFDVAPMLRADLADARRAWLKAAKSDPKEHGRRSQSDFLAEANHEGEHLDFHSLRHTCGAWLALAGCHPKVAQAVTRHSTITLTMDTYGHLFPGQESEAVARLPGMLSPTHSPEAMRATGTEGGARKWAQLGQQSAGGMGLAAAKCGEPAKRQNDAPGGPTQSSQPLAVAKVGEKKATRGERWRRAEGKGVEPSTGYPAPDFESVWPFVHLADRLRIPGILQTEWKPSPCGWVADGLRTGCVATSAATV